VIGLNDGYREILDAIASDSPTPGGGSVAALSLAHAHALVCMVARLTLKSGKWESGHDTATKVLNGSHKGISDAINLARRDAESFDSVMLAFRMPKTTDEEISQRRSAIERGYLMASKVPLETAETGVVLLQEIAKFATNCNANAAIDIDEWAN
jgi:formiminotetrahydrofolate cyclodeaminase